ncbi:MAG: hypothetical protein J4432_05495 [DPANN group archaeon]|nr:hypothetical protein [DPANN group archaeon]
MVSITVSVPVHTKELMNKFSEINWSGFVRKCIEQKADQLSWKDDMLKRLKKEEEFSEWAVETLKISRKGRLLKKKGLI